MQVLINALIVAMHAADQNNSFSYFRIGGIHGWPYEPYDSDSSDPREPGDSSD